MRSSVPRGCVRVSRPSGWAAERRARWVLLPALVIAALSACAGEDVTSEEDALGESASEASCAKPVGLALNIENGVGTPLRVRAGQTFYLNQVDIRASKLTGVDEGVAGLTQAGDFAGLAWNGLKLEEADVAANPDGTFSRRRYYRGAKWMDHKSTFTLTQVNQQGKTIGKAVELDLGKDSKVKSSDFFIRRLRAIQWTHGCAAPDCAGATQFEEEALVEIRNTLDEKPFTISPAAVALRLKWSARPGDAYVIPVEQVASPQYDYGFSIDIDVLTPPNGPGGSFLAGSDITFQATLRDGSGKRLHPPGSLPSFAEACFGPNESGIQYYQGFFDPAILYYRNKHRERMMMAQIIGPAQNIQPIRSVIPVESFLFSEVQHAGLPERDGVYGDYVLFPRGPDLLGGAVGLTANGWVTPVSDTWTNHIPENAAPGTYLVTMKARRVYLGEDVPFTRTIKIQVGSPAPTVPVLTTGKCQSCHEEGSSLGVLLHANDNRAACASCHAPHAFELDNAVHVRVHFIHSRSTRYEESLKNCSTCHLTPASIQRVSKSACLSCHTSYPSSHVAQFGPVENFAVGGSQPFEQCTSTCHTTHKGSKL